MSGGMAEPAGWLRLFHGGRGEASKPDGKQTQPIADRRSAMPSAFVVARKRRDFEAMQSPCLSTEGIMAICIMMNNMLEKVLALKGEKGYYSLQ